MEDPAFAEGIMKLHDRLLRDHPELKPRLQKGDLLGLATDPRVLKLLDDPEFTRLLDSISALDTRGLAPAPR